MRGTKIAGLSQAFDTLLGTGALVKVGADVYRGTQIAEIRARLDRGDPSETDRSRWRRFATPWARRESTRCR